MSSKTLLLLPILLLTSLFYAPSLNAGWLDKDDGTEQKKPEFEEVDHLTLAAVMIKDGHYDRARAELQRIDINREGLDLARYYTILGLLELNSSQFAKAKDAFLSALENGQTDLIVHIYLAQAFYNLQEFEKTLESIDNAGDIIADMPGIYGLRAQCCWQLQRWSDAYRTLLEAELNFPDRKDFSMQKVFLLIELKLNREAYAESSKYLDKYGDSDKVFLIVGEALRRSRQFENAKRVLERANLKFPNNEKIMLSLAHTYMQAGMEGTAARIFERIALLNSKYYNEAIGLYRRTGDIWRALFLNTLVKNQEEKIKQRLEILLEQKRYEESMALYPRLQRFNLLEDDNIKYAMAYVNFQVGAFDQAEKMLKQVRDKKLFRKVTQLIKAIEIARNSDIPFYY